MAVELGDAIEQLITNLKEITEFNDQVWDGEPPRIHGQTAGIILDSATISNMGGSDCMEIHIITIRVYIPVKKMEDVEEAMREAWKDVRNRLFLNQTLSGTAQQCLPSGYNMGYQNVSGVLCRVMSISARLGLRPIVTYNV